MIRTSLRTAPLLACLTLTACSNGGGPDSTSTPEPGSILLEATDAPFDHQVVERATIWVDRVRIHHADDVGDAGDADDDSGWIDLHEGEAIRLDLLDLQGGVTEVLARGELEPGAYGSLRLRVSAAELELINGALYSTDDGTIQLSSQDTSGFKLYVDPPIEIESGRESRFLLDFDLTRTFHPIPANDPLTAARYKLHPVIRVANLGLAGALRGRTLTAEGGDLVIVAGAVVFLLAPGETDVENAIATTASDDEGRFAFLGLAGGEYDVLARKDEAQGRVDGVLVTQGETSEVDVVLE